MATNVKTLPIQPIFHCSPIVLAYAYARTYTCVHTHVCTCARMCTYTCVYTCTRIHWFCKPKRPMAFPIKQKDRRSVGLHKPIVTPFPFQIRSICIQSVYTIDQRQTFVLQRFAYDCTGTSVPWFMSDWLVPELTPIRYQTFPDNGQP